MAEKIIKLYTDKFGLTDCDGNKTVYEHEGSRYIILGNREYNIDKLSEEEARHLFILIKEW